jgi:hypothetical protein
MKRIIMAICFMAIGAGLCFAEEAAKSESKPEGQDAVILYSKGKIDHNFTLEMSKISFEIKMKFVSQKAIDDSGSLTLEYSPPEENIGGIEGHVTTPDGKTVDITSKDIFKKKILKKGKEKVMEVRVVFPSLAVGSTVEYSYYKSFIGLSKISYWPFQNEYFTELSEVSFIPDPGRRWGFSIRNPIEEPEKKETRPGGNTMVTFIRHNISELVKEPYSKPYDSIRESISFYYVDTNSKYENFWAEWGPELYKAALKNYCKPCSSAKKIVKQDFKDHPKNDSLIPDLYHYVITHFSSIDLLSKKEEELVDENYMKKLAKKLDIEDLFDLNLLSGYQINYVLASLISSAASDAQIQFAFYIPWDEEIFDPFLKSISQFRELMLKVTYQGKTYWLCPSMRFMKPNMMESAVKGCQVFLMGKNGCGFEKIPLDKETDNQSLTSTKVTFDQEAGIVLMDRRRECDPYEAYAMRSSLNFYSDEERKDFLQKALIEIFGNDTKLESFEISGLEDIAQPLIINERFQYPFEFEEAGDQILFRLPGFAKHKENPFSAASRSDQILLPYAMKKTQEVTYQLPASLTCTTVPSNTSINPNVLLYSLSFERIDDHQFKLKSTETLQGNMLKKEAFQLLQTTYNKMMEADNKAIILKQD